MIPTFKEKGEGRKARGPFLLISNRTSVTTMIRGAKQGTAFWINGDCLTAAEENTL
jgi:hypothetical protein